MEISTNEIVKAVRNEKYLVYYQPKVEATTEKIVGFEALVRLQTEKGILTPIDFFREVAKQKAARTMQNFVINTVMKQIDAFEGKYTISVNVISSDVIDDAYMDALYDRIRLTMKHPGALNLEIVERTEITHLTEACHNLMKIKSLGPTVSLDDFGKGYSSLTYLRALPVDFIKIDPSFISLIKTNERQRIIMRAIVNLSHDLGCPIIAEGIETEAEIAILREMGVDYFQGYYYGRPMPIKKYMKKN
ncbi:MULTISPECIES: EAL domain-containing protein [Listeria]|uniref:EAL domain-containing protein n=1 Tax=Listeria TaxID=1637 RepID=UPI000B587D76|nr:MULTISPECIES: EAL domain-containing protein [Listeria]